MKSRLDVELTRRGLTESRQKAQELIRVGSVKVNSAVVTKPSQAVEDTDDIEITGKTPKYVGRGGLKLEHALKTFEIDVSEKLCLDIGASTGGFTDCLLQNGAKKVCAVDVGHGQLHPSLQAKPEVVSLEGMNIRDLTLEDIGYSPDFVCCDVSFISLTVVIEKISKMLDYSSECVFLIKPQFEAGRGNIGKNGIVKDKKVHVSVISKILDCCRENEINPLGVCRSAITGGDGNVEYLLHGKKQKDFVVQIDVKSVVG